MVNTLTIVDLIMFLACIAVSFRVFFLWKKWVRVVAFSSEIQGRNFSAMVVNAGETYNFFFDLTPGPEGSPGMLDEVWIYREERRGFTLRFRYLSSEQTVERDVNLRRELIARCLRAIDAYPKSQPEQSICTSSIRVIMNYLEGGPGFSTTMVEGPVPEE